MNKKPFPERISGKRIELRKVELSWARLIFDRIDQDRERLQKFLPWVGLIQTLAHEEEYLRSADEAWKSGKIFDFGIFDLQSDQYLGAVGAHHIDWANENVDLGYWISSRFEGKGYVSEAVTLLECALFDHGFMRVVIRCASHNPRSVSVPRRLNYQWEGLVGNGEIGSRHAEDVLVFAKLNSARLEGALRDFTQVSVVAKDLEKSIEWYRKALGNDPTIAVKNHVEFVSGGQSLYFQGTEGNGTGYWKTDSLPQAIRHFESLGAKVYRGPLEIPGQMAVCQIQDPVGGIFGVMGPPK